MSPDAQAEPVIFCCASDEGAYFADIRGKILRHHRVGHAQNPTVANFRDDLPGLEALSMNFWGNQGTIHLFNSRGEIYHDFEPCQHGSPCSPVNWTGGSEEFFCSRQIRKMAGCSMGWAGTSSGFPMTVIPTCASRCSISRAIAAMSLWCGTRMKCGSTRKVIALKRAGFTTRTAIRTTTPRTIRHISRCQGGPTIRQRVGKL